MRANWLKHIALIVLVSSSTASAAAAQTSRSDHQDLERALMPGTTVWITGQDNREEKARIVDVSGDVVTTNVRDEIRRFSTNEIARVRARRSDSVVNGALIGAGAAVASGLAFCRLIEPWEVCRNNVGPLIRIGAVGAGMGIGIDALIRGRRTIYDAEAETRLNVAPVVERGARGVQVSVSF